MEQTTLVKPLKDVDGYTRYDLKVGGWVREAIGIAVLLIKQGEAHGIKFEKDGVLVKILADSDTDKLFQAWVWARRCLISRTVGPHPIMWWEILKNSIWWAVDLFGKPFERVSSE